MKNVKQLFIVLSAMFLCAVLGILVYANPFTGNDYSANVLGNDLIVKKAICGDGVMEKNEECDDGNLENGDGCSDSCEIEGLDLSGNNDEVVDDDDDDDNDDDDADDDDADGDEECTDESARKKIDNAQRKIDKSEAAIEKKEAQGKDVTKALESLEEAKAELEEAQAALDGGDCDGALDLAKDSKHTANMAKGKDVLSASPRALVARAFGKCISEAAKAKDFAQFAVCHQEFKSDVQDQVEEEMSEEDQALNEQISLKIDEYLEGIGDEDLRAALEAFKEYNFSGIDAEALFAEIEAILDSEMSNEEKIAALEELFADYQEESVEDKYDDDEIPFTDADDNEWFFAYADILKAEACISGYVNEDGTLTGEFGPGEPVLMGESLKFVLSCILGEEPAEIGEEDFWALAWAYVLQNEYAEYVNEPFLARVEAAIVDITLFNEGASRAEIIQLIVDLLDVELPEVTEAPFSDVPVDHPNAAAIAYALELGVISGDEEEGTFRPDDIPNRAEMVKIIIMAKELM